MPWVKTHELLRANKTHKLPGYRNNNLNFRLARDQVVHLETVENLSAKRSKQNNFFAVNQYFLVGRYNKTLNDWSHGKQ